MNLPTVRHGPGRSPGSWITTIHTYHYTLPRHQLMALEFNLHWIPRTCFLIIDPVFTTFYQNAVGI